MKNKQKTTSYNPHACMTTVLNKVGPVLEEGCNHRADNYTRAQVNRQNVDTIFFTLNSQLLQIKYIALFHFYAI